jgi:putative transposase
VSFISANKDHFGVEPICKVLPFAPTTYYAAATRAAVRT